MYLFSGMNGKPFLVQVCSDGGSQHFLFEHGFPQLFKWSMLLNFQNVFIYYQYTIYRNYSDNQITPSSTGSSNSFFFLAYLTHFSEKTGRCMKDVDIYSISAKPLLFPCRWRWETFGCRRPQPVESIIPFGWEKRCSLNKCNIKLISNRNHPVNLNECLLLQGVWKFEPSTWLAFTAIDLGQITRNHLRGKLMFQVKAHNPCVDAQSH